MSMLHRKVLRDAWHIKGQLAAICVVTACGIGTFVMSFSVMHSLERTLDEYYRESRFAHVFASLKRAPEATANRLRAIEGVSDVDTRIVTQVMLDLDDTAEPATGQTVSISTRGASSLNALYIRRGRLPAPDRTNEVLASEGFAQAHRLEPGDIVRALLNGRLRTWTIVGIAVSPEYIYQIRPGYVFPDDRAFGIFWMDHKALAAALDMEGAFNDVAVYLSPGANSREVIAKVDHELARYGCTGAYSREDQSSNRYLTNELRELRNMGSFAPVIFLVVSSFLLNMVLARIVGIQREQIGALRALGFSRRTIGWHFVQLVSIVVAVGLALGLGLGIWFGNWLTGVYSRYFRFPTLDYRLDIRTVIWAAAITTAAGFAGTLVAVIRASRVSPAEAMAPEKPARYRLTMVERLGLQRWVPLPLRMILRQMERKPIAPLLTLVAISLGVGILILGNYAGDSLDYMISLRFDTVQREDISVTFVEPTESRVRFDLAHLPGVERCEVYRGAAARLAVGVKQRREGILGLEANSTLFRVVDPQSRAWQLPKDGLIISAKLGEILEVGIGEKITVEFLEKEIPPVDLLVVGLVDEFIGATAYMEIGALQKLLGEGETISGAFLKADPGRLGQLYSTLKRTPRIAGVNVKESGRRSLRQTLAENLLRMKAVNAIFAAVIAFGVVYVSALIALSERGRELATLRIVGFSRVEVFRILLGELVIVAAIAIPLGLFVGYGFAVLASRGYDTDLFRLPLIVQRSTYANAVIIVLASMLISAGIVRRRIDRLDLVSALKIKE